MLLMSLSKPGAPQGPGQVLVRAPPQATSEAGCTTGLGPAVDPCPTGPLLWGRVSMWGTQEGEDQLSLPVRSRWSHQPRAWSPASRASHMQ